MENHKTYSYLDPEHGDKPQGVRVETCRRWSAESDFELGNIDLLIQFAKYDFGIACVIRNFIDDDLSSGRLFEIKPIEKIPPRSIAAAWLKNVALAPAARELINNLDYFETSEI